MAKNHQILPHIAMSEYEEEMAFLKAEDNAWFDALVDEWFEEDEWFEDRAWSEENCFHSSLYEVEKLKKEQQVDACWEAYHDDLAENPWAELSDDYWYYLCGECYCLSFLEVWDKLEAGCEDFYAPIVDNAEDHWFRESSSLARRRHNAIAAKQRIVRNSANAVNAYRKRNREDMNNGYRCKKRGGREVRMPKSLGLRTIKIYKQAAKLQ